jgi:hypothetical protein
MVILNRRRFAVVDWSDPETFWLNVTNAALGLVTFIALLVVGGAVVTELLHRMRARLSATETEPHRMMVPELGATMADGGEKVKDDKKSS